MDDILGKIALAKQIIAEQDGYIVREGRKYINKYGYAENVGTSAVDIWSYNSGAVSGVNIPEITTDRFNYVVSDNNSDTQTLTFECFTKSSTGLKFFTQTKTLTGQTPVLLDTACADSSRIRGYSAGNVYVMEGNSVSSGVPTDTSKVINHKPAGKKASFRAATSVAQNNYLLLLSMWAGVNKKSSASGFASILIEEVLGQGFIEGPTFPISNGKITSPPVFEIISPNSRIKLNADMDTGGTQVAGGFFGIFLDIIGRTS